LINAILLFVVLSAANSNVYSGSRILLGLANDHCAPRILKKTTNGGVPIPAVLCTAAMGLLAYLNLSNGGGKVFNWFLNITAVAGFITWTCISGSHIAFMRALKARGIDRNTLPYKALGQPWFAWYGFGFNILIIFTQGFTSFMPWDVTSFFISYISVILFVVLYVGHKVVTRAPFVKAEEADITTGCINDDATNWSITAPTTKWGKFCEHIC
jgi:amino acid transporter